MTAKILDGKQIAHDIREELKGRAAELKAKGVVPGLGVLLVGNDPASRSYVTAKERACAEIGLYSNEIVLPETATKDEILAVVEGFNADERIHGILVQLPLPDSSMEQAVIAAILPEKDADGFHPISVGKMMLGEETYLPCTPHGILQILKRSGIETCGAHVVVIGRSNIVGRPIANMLSQKTDTGNATVTMVHTRTKNMKELVKQADIIIAAVGWPNTVTADMVKEGAVIIDVGVNRVEDATAQRGYRLKGDVDYEACAEVASAITPVPGGVGPMTITMLMSNTIEAAERTLR
jgi:methylenetetrahydrofolate dehydrogenase (NADP+)/methenyltetrahydrofolate cyclohydrolase